MVTWTCSGRHGQVLKLTMPLVLLSALFDLLVGMFAPKLARISCDTPGLVWLAYLQGKNGSTTSSVFVSSTSLSCYPTWLPTWPVSSTFCVLLMQLLRVCITFRPKEMALDTDMDSFLIFLAFGIQSCNVWGRLSARSGRYRWDGQLRANSRRSENPSLVWIVEVFLLSSCRCIFLSLALLTPCIDFRDTWPCRYALCVLAVSIWSEGICCLNAV